MIRIALHICERNQPRERKKKYANILFYNDSIERGICFNVCWFMMSYMCIYSEIPNINIQFGKYSPFFLLLLFLFRWDVSHLKHNDCQRFSEMCALRVPLISKFSNGNQIYHLDETKLVFTVKRFTVSQNKKKSGEETITATTTVRKRLHQLLPISIPSYCFTWLQKRRCQKSLGLLFIVCCSLLIKYEIYS